MKIKVHVWLKCSWSQTKMFNNMFNQGTTHTGILVNVVYGDSS